MTALLLALALCAQVGDAPTSDPTAPTTAPTTATTTATTTTTLSAPTTTPAVNAPVAQPDAAAIERARGLYVAGSEAYGAGRYDVAIDAFDEVLRVAPRGQVVFSLAQACRLQFFVDGDPQKLERAVTLYRRYVVEEPAGPRRDHAAEHLSVLVPMLERLRLEQGALASGAAGGAVGGAAATAPARLIVSSETAGARASIDGGEPRAIPATFEVEPGAHVVVVSADLHQAARRTTVAIAAAAIALDVDLEPLPAHLVIKGPDDVVVHVDGGVVAGTTIALRPGAHDVRVGADNRVAFAERVTLAPGETRVLAPSLPLTSQTLAGAASVITGGVVVVAAGVPLLLVLATEGEARRLEGERATRALTVDEAQSYGALADERDLWARTGIIATAAGATLVAAGLLALLLDSEPVVGLAPASSTTTTTITMTPAPTAEPTAATSMAPEGP